MVGAFSSGPYEQWPLQGTEEQQLKLIRGP
jgi:hypothetical protein